MLLSADHEILYIMNVIVGYSIYHFYLCSVYSEYILQYMLAAAGTVYSTPCKV